MGLNETHSSNRIHIGFFGRRNAGKSSVVNAVTNQDLAIVSEKKGTTTDPVYKSMEILPLGPVMIIDTPGLDDEGELGYLRIKKTKQVLNKVDIAVLIVDATIGITDLEKELINVFKQKSIEYIVAYNKKDLYVENFRTLSNEVYISAINKEGIDELKEKIASISIDNKKKSKGLLDGVVGSSEIIVLVTPIDAAAPKGRLILPQQQTIREILDRDSTAIVVKELGLKNTLLSLKDKPSLVITDSQAFEKVSSIVPKEIPLTSFSILMARYKGFLETSVKGVRNISNLRDGDTVLISEGCTHHRQCDDIGTVKIPQWLRSFTGKNINIETTSGMDFKENLSKYSLIIHCGGCMLNEREIKYRMDLSIKQNVPFTNYGIAIAFMKGILNRSIEIFPNLT